MLDITERDRLAIKATIAQQLQAFAANNAPLAFSYASPGIQLQFQTPDHFMQMVERAYAPIYRPRSVIFEDLSVIDQQPTQTVLIFGDNERLVRALYLMQQQLDQRWRINGCLLLPIQSSE
jgi:hypothetical protein